MVLEPLAFSVPDVSLDSRPMTGNMDWNPSEHAVPEEDQTSRPMEGVTGPEPLGHSVMKLHLDSQPSRNKLEAGTVRTSGAGRHTTQSSGFL